MALRHDEGWESSIISTLQVFTSSGIVQHFLDGIQFHGSHGCFELDRGDE